MGFACRGYSESVPNPLHKNVSLYPFLIHRLGIFSQYPLYLLLLLLLLSCIYIDNILGEEPFSI